VFACSFRFRLECNVLKRILVVEDDNTILALIRIVVERSGYAVLEATSAQQAFQHLEKHAHIDLLIADVTLPASSGIRVALELRYLLPRLKVIVTSGYPRALWNEQDAAELDELPSDSVAVLQKPFVPKTLLEKIHRLIGFASDAVPAMQRKAAP
jgi:CheY-like chemotaxis protein